MTWKGLFQHLESLPLDEYYEFKHAHEIQIEEWWLYWSPNYVSITRGIVAPSVAMATPSISSTNGSRSAISSGNTINGGITEGGGARASTSTWGPLPIFNLVVEFFRELQQNYQGVRTQKL
jgi:hypothetical protein